jgi:hypothetical protein
MNFICPRQNGEVPVFIALGRFRNDLGVLLTILQVFKRLERCRRDHNGAEEALAFL